MSEAWIGVDVGTTAIKAAAYRSDGTAIAMAERATEVLRTADGGAEQDMDVVWKSTCDCLRKLAGECSEASIRSIGVCAQGDGFWPVDANGRAVRKAILWSDTRRESVEDLEALAQSGATATVGRGCHTDLWPGTSALGWRWLRKCEPENAARVAHILTCGDWIGLNLTGQVQTDFSNATIPFLDLKIRRYGAAVSGLDCEDAAGKLPAPKRAQTKLGSLTAEAAAQTGLPEGLLVSTPTLDLGAMIVGLGMSKPGETMMILGTTAVVNILTDQVEPTDTPIAASVLHSTHDAIIRVLAPTTGAAAFDWFASLHPQSLGGDSAGEVAKKLNALVEEVPAGANGVTFLPYLNGERAPFVEPSLRASFQGLSAATTKGELGRAVMEGTAMSLRHCFVSEGGLPDKPVQLTGGGARNPVWCQIIANVVGQDILVNSAADLGLWGAACISAAAAGAGDPVALAERKEEIVRYPADPEQHAAYKKVFARYEILSETARKAQSKLASLGET